MKKKIYGAFALVLAAALALPLGAVPTAQAAGDRTYTVTANLYVPGDLNTQLPGVTAYVTNPNNPLGVVPDNLPAGMTVESKAPTEPISNNATLTVSSTGTITLTVPLPNPVFTIQKISGCSNATIVSAPKDSNTYGTSDGSATRTGRVTSLTLELKDTSGTYVFTDCKEFPTLLGVDWTVPLTLAVDFSGVDLTAGSASAQTTPSGSGSAAKSVNLDSLKALVQTVEKVTESAVVSQDGSDVDAAETWTTQDQLDTLKTALGKAKAAQSAADQTTVDKAVASLKSAYETYQDALQSGKSQGGAEHLGKTLSPGTYTISANIWFNKADTGLPLNPHLTNSTFPPYNPVPDNATLTVNEDGTSQVEIPIVIQDKVMTLRSIYDLPEGLAVTEAPTNDTGAITSLTVDLGNLTGDSTVVTYTCTCDIWMGDLAMSISGLEKEHTWPATFELNLSGVATTDGGAMPEVELELLDAQAATEAMASVTGDDAQEETEEASGSTAAVVIVIIVVAAAAAAGGYAYYKKKKNSEENKEGTE